MLPCYAKRFVYHASGRAKCSADASLFANTQMASRAWMLCVSTAIEGYKAMVSLLQFFSLYTNLYIYILTHQHQGAKYLCKILKIRGNTLMSWSRTIGSEYSSDTMYISIYGDIRQHEATWGFEICGSVWNPGYNLQVATLKPWKWWIFLRFPHLYRVQPFSSAYHHCLPCVFS
jgi:hypothetical protein